MNKKQFEELKNSIQIKVTSVTNEKYKEIRKQVCDEIRNLAIDYFTSIINENCQILKKTDTYISSNDFNEILE